MMLAVLPAHANWAVRAAGLAWKVELLTGARVTWTHSLCSRDVL